MHELDECVAAVNSEDERDRISHAISIAFRWCFINLDGATLHAATKLPYFNMFANSIVNDFSVRFMKNDDAVFFAKLYDALLPHIDLKHESGLRRLLCNVIIESYPTFVLEFADALWSSQVIFRILKTCIVIFLKCETKI